MFREEKAKLRVEIYCWKYTTLINREGYLHQKGIHKNLHKEEIYQYYKDSLDKRILRRCKNRSKEKGLEFDLTLEWVRERLEKGTCETSGRVFDLAAEGKPSINSPSIDRIDCAKGYTMDNCRMVVWGWNMACGPWGEEALIDLFKDVLKTTHQEKNF